MMSLKVAEAMYNRGRIIRDDENYGWLIDGDIASGEGLRDKSAGVVIRVIGYGDMGPDARRVEVVRIPYLTNKIRSNKFAYSLAEHDEGLSNVTFVIDSGGLGINVCQDLEDANKVVHRVNWGNPCFRKSHKERYANLRAMAMHQAARAAKDGRISILTLDYKKALIGQSSRIPKTFTEKAKVSVPPKHSKEWDGLGSPDLWDAICFAFLENVNYIVADNYAIKVSESSADKAAASANNMFADVD
jgi:hypothetical protein